MKSRLTFLAAAAAALVLSVTAGCTSGKAPAASGSDSAAGRTGGEKSGETPEPARSKAEQAELKPQETCPVMGGKIVKDVYADYKGQRVYFCCPGCEKSFLKNPEMYIAKMKSQGQKPEQIK